MIFKLIKNLVSVLSFLVFSVSGFPETTWDNSRQSIPIPYQNRDKSGQTEMSRAASISLAERYQMITLLMPFLKKKSLILVTEK